MKKKEYMNILKENVLQTVSSNWSTQSPDLNSTENLWDELKTKIQEGVAKKKHSKCGGVSVICQGRMTVITREIC